MDVNTTTPPDSSPCRLLRDAEIGHPSLRGFSLRDILTFLFVAAFLLVLAAPLGWRVVRGEASQSDAQENRKLAAFPDMRKGEWRKLPAQFDSYFSDNLGLRGRFLNAYLRIFNSGLQSPGGRYLTGNQGELFEKEVVVNALGLNPNTPEYLAMLRTAAAGTAAWFSLHDIPYYLFLVPDKSTLYPEWLPFYAHLVPRRGWYAELEKALRSANILFYPLKNFFEENKNEFRLYDKIFDNCHWNGQAIKLFYQNIQKFIPENVYDFDIDNTIEYIQIHNFNINDGIYGNDSVPFLWFEQKDFLEDRTKELFGKDRAGWWESRFFINHNKKDQSIWMISDSYLLGTHGADVLPIFAFNAHKCVNVHFDQFNSNLAEKLLKDNKPDIVIGEFVERMGGLGFSVVHDKRITMLGDVWTKTPGYVIDGDSLQTATINNAELSQNGDEIQLKILNSNCSIVFPEIMTDEYGHAMLMSRLHSDIDANTFLFYTLGESRERILSKTTMALPVAKIRKGENYVHLHIIATPNTRVKLHFVPAAPTGTYTFLPIPEVEELKKKLAHGL